VVRTTKIFTSGDLVNVFGTAIDINGSWSTTICWSCVDAAAAINGANNTRITNINAPGSQPGTVNSTLTCVPSAISVQVMQTRPLQATQGLVYAGVCPAQMSLIDNSRTWDSFSGGFTSYFKPRLMTNPKLALKGVQMNSYPLNMSAISNFEAVQPHGDGVTTWTSGNSSASSGQYITGWAPIVVINQGHATDPLTFAVTVEWRVRFDFSNPAVSSHRHYPVTSDRVWDGMVRAASSLGNNVREITDLVANAGQAAESVAKVAGFLAID